MHRRGHGQPGIRLPVDRVVRVLQQVGALLVDEPVRVRRRWPAPCTTPVGLRSNKWNGSF